MNKLMNMKTTKALFGATLLTALLAASSMASASPIYYWATNVEGDTWQYDYAVGNEIGTDIDWFSIYFDPALYAFDTLDLGAGYEEVNPDHYRGATDWDVFVAAPDPLLPGPSDDQWGYYDAFAFGDPVFPDALVSGFSVVFTWLGTGTPGSQPFTLFGGDLLPELQENYFTQVPEPGTLGLLGASFALLGFARRKSARPPANV